MTWLLYVAGAALIGVAMLDALWTTLATGGGGPITSRLSQGVWRAVLHLHQRHSQGSHRMLQITGTVILLLIIGAWIVLLWSGWTLLFSAETAAVVNAQTREPAGLASRIYYTGYTLFTLGMGNYVPRVGHWEILTAVASVNGLFLVTLAITYLVPVVSAAIEKRRLAAVISDLGRTPQAIVRRGWNGESFDALSTALSQIVPMIELHTQRHLAYPVLHYFHSPHLRTAVGPSIAALDEALILLTTAVQPQVRPPATVTKAASDAVAGLLETLRRQYISSADDLPPPPSLEELRGGEVPLIGQEAFRQAVDACSERRRLMYAFVENDGWTWSQVVTVPDDAPLISLNP